MMDSLLKYYNWAFYENADPRVKDWPLMTTPMYLVLICCVYLIMVKLVLPYYMRNRRPYNLKKVIKWYNIFQIVINAYVTWGILTSGWTTSYHFGCLIPDYSDDPMAIRMLTYMWYTIFLKMVEMIETCFFILRKKDSQASFLHVYHHVTTTIIIWNAVKFVGGGMTSFTPLINNAVHVIMYSYYLAAAEGSPKLKQLLNRYKMWITVLQMIQFTLMFVHGVQVLLPSCKAPKGITYIYFPNLFLVYYMFYNFFKKNYVQKSVLNKSS